jgi:hypothetical protein
VGKVRCNISARKGLAKSEAMHDPAAAGPNFPAKKLVTFHLSPFTFTFPLCLSLNPFYVFKEND